jgi:hypothetical protein
MCWALITPHRFPTVAELKIPPRSPPFSELTLMESDKHILENATCSICNMIGISVYDFAKNPTGTRTYEENSPPWICIYCAGLAHRALNNFYDERGKKDAPSILQPKKFQAFEEIPADAYLPKNYEQCPNCGFVLNDYIQNLIKDVPSMGIDFTPEKMTTLVIKNRTELVSKSLRCILKNWINELKAEFPDRQNSHRILFLKEKLSLITPPGEDNDD